MAGSGEETKSKIEGGVWRDATDKAYLAWNEAQMHRKDQLLLSGPALAWAESDVLAHPENYSQAQKRFIAKSLNEQAARSARGRKQAELEERKNDSRVRWAIVGVAAFTVVQLSNSLVKDALERSINGHRRPTIAQPARSPDQQRAELSSPEGTPGIAEPATEGEAPGRHATEGNPRPDGTPTAVPPPASPRPTRDAGQPPDKAEQARQLASLRRLTVASSDRAQKGEAREAMLLAIEAVRESEARSAQLPAEEARILMEEAAAALFPTLAERRPLLGAGEEWAAGTWPQFCPGDRVVGAVSGAAGLRIQRQAQSSPAAETAKVPTPLRLAPDCSLALVSGEDYGIELWPVVGGQAPVAGGQPKAQQESEPAAGGQVKASSLALARGNGRAGRLSGHEADVLAVHVSKDNRLVATASHDGTGRLFEARSGRRLAVLSGHDGPVHAIDVSSDGRLAATGSEDKHVRLWETGGGRLLATLSGHQGTVTSATFNPAADRLLTVSVDGMARIWDVAGRRALHVLGAAQSSIIAAQWSPDGSRIGAIAHNGTVHVFEPQSGSLVAALPSVADEVRSLIFTSDSGAVATLSWKGIAGYWQIDGKAPLIQLNGASEPVGALAFAREDSQLIAVARNGAQLSWPVPSSIADAARHAATLAGPCLTPEERAKLGLASALPGWCKQQGTAAASGSQ